MLGRRGFLAEARSAPVTCAASPASVHRPSQRTISSVCSMLTESVAAMEGSSSDHAPSTSSTGGGQGHGGAGDHLPAWVNRRRQISWRPKGSNVSQAQVQIHRLAKALQAQGRLHEARAELRRGLAKHPSDVHLLSLGASVEIKVGDVREAERLLGRALVLEPEHPGLLSSLGRLLARTGRVKEAREAFGAAHNSNPRGAAGVLQVRVNGVGRVKGSGLSGGSHSNGVVPPNSHTFVGAVMTSHL